MSPSVWISWIQQDRYFTEEQHYSLFVYQIHQLVYFQGDQLDNHIRWGDGFMLTYSVTDRSSFEAVTRLHRLVLTSRRCQSTSFVLVGNKNDLSHQRRVTHAEGEQLALELGCTFFEVSACDGDHDVFEAFYELHRDVSRRRGTLGRLRRSSAQQVIHAFNKMFTKMNVWRKTRASLEG